MKETRIVEEKSAKLFAVKKPFSEHLSKWEDDLLPDKYDSNCFEYCGQPTRDELEAALAYQRARGDSFIKLEGDAPLDASAGLAKEFGLEEGCTVTMVLTDSDADWNTNDGLCFRTPSLPELEAIELKHYGPVYGESFAVRNIRRLYEKFQYHGAYIGDKLVGCCHIFTSDGMTCIDGLLVDDEYRKQYIATSLLAHIRDSYPETTLFLHAETDDTPKDMYLKMGFEITDYLYEYSRMDLQDNACESIIKP